MIDDRAMNSPGSACPYCNGPLAAADEPAWTPVARVTNLAEAGFLANDLSTHGIATRIFDAENFSAVAGGWSAAYLIQVPTADANQAATHIREHLASEPADDPFQYDGDAEHEINEPVDPVFWRPVALMVIAGVASFILGQQVAGDRAAAQPAGPRNSLPASIDSIGRSFLTEPVAGGPRHRLSYHHQHNCWYLETDADGDGRYESFQRFRRDGAGW
jgi:hypothetical protein